MSKKPFPIGQALGFVASTGIAWGLGFPPLFFDILGIPRIPESLAKEALKSMANVGVNLGCEFGAEYFKNFAGDLRNSLAEQTNLRQLFLQALHNALVETKTELAKPEYESFFNQWIQGLDEAVKDVSGTKSKLLLPPKWAFDKLFDELGEIIPPKEKAAQDFSSIEYVLLRLLDDANPLKFIDGDFLKARELALGLAGGADETLLNHIRKKIDSATLQKIDGLLKKNYPENELAKVLTDVFNTLLDEKFLYDKEAFKNLDKEAKRLAKLSDEGKLEGEELWRCNRLLLESAFPDYIAPLEISFDTSLTTLGLSFSHRKTQSATIPSELRTLLQNHLPANLEASLPSAIASDPKLMQEFAIIQATHAQKTLNELKADIKKLVDGQLQPLSKHEQALLEKSLQTLEENLGGFIKGLSVEIKERFDDFSRQLKAIDVNVQRGTATVEKTYSELSLFRKIFAEFVENFFKAKGEEFFRVVLPPSKETVLKYLNELAEESAKLPTYYPLHLRQNTKDGSTPFDSIRQQVRVVEDREKFKALLTDENNRLAGLDSSTLKLSPYSFTHEQEREEKPAQPEDWEKVRERYKQAVILGDPGFGKSWLLRYEARRIASEQARRLSDDEITLDEMTLPILIRLTDLARYAEDKLVSEGLADWASGVKRENELSEEFRLWVSEKIKKGHCVVLLDAMDEVVTEPREPNVCTRKHLREKLKDFSERRPPCRILLTSRIVGYEGSPIKEEKELELVFFETEQIKRFSEVWFADGGKAAEFMKLLQDQMRVGWLGRIPLMLALLCRLFGKKSKDEKFPGRRVEIYERCLRGLLKDWKEEDKQEQISDEDVDEKLEILSEAAYELFVKQGYQFSTTQLKQAMLKCLGVDEKTERRDGYAKKKIQELKDDGILIEANAEGDGQMLFLHRTFHEYLAACGLAKVKEWKEIALKEEHLYDSEWSQVLQLLGGKLEGETEKETQVKVEGYIKDLLAANGENGENDVFFRPFMLAMHAAVEAGANISDEFRLYLMNQALEKLFDPPHNLPNDWFLTVARCWGKRITPLLVRRLEGKAE